MRVGRRKSALKLWSSLRRYVMHAHMKRTTLILDSAVWSELRRRAATEGRTLTELVERTMRLGLDASAPARRARTPLPSFDLGPFLVAVADRARRAGGAPREDV